jgi:hypothetical protein
MSSEVKCGNCGARNRLKATSGGLAPICGKCGAPLRASTAAAPVSAILPRARLSNAQMLVVIGMVALALTGVAELLLMILY